MADTTYGYTVIFTREEDGFVATVPTLNFISTYGDTLDEAREMAAEMIQLYLESLQADGIELPAPDQRLETFTEQISVALA